MRLTLVATVFVLTACGGLDASRTEISMHESSPAAPEASPFTGAWESCEGASSSEECSRYVLVQRGERICGTWSYVATGRSYEGRLIAKTVSQTSAIATQVCGRVGSEASTECKDGWQEIRKALNVCDGKLADVRRDDGACAAEYIKTEILGSELIAAQPWIATCLGMSP